MNNNQEETKKLCRKYAEKGMRSKNFDIVQENLENIGNFILNLKQDENFFHNHTELFIIYKELFDKGLKMAIEKGNNEFKLAKRQEILNDFYKYRRIFKEDIFGGNKSFCWCAKNDAMVEEELTNLYRKLTASLLISKNTTIENFLDIFTDQPIEKITPIQWLGKPVLLAYFLNMIKEKGKISFKNDLWATAAICFDGYNRKQLNNLFTRTLHNKNPKHPGKPRNYQLIEDLLL